ncbi:hypothetical protein RHGRI_028553 [Rhododendron griersonianum]|uniref:Uncharacterized protein n=1 Tax=Rhododendron griersonianum TaxID=479676 RepID=A0AAV6IGP3_9ERIC|nr:hypothetical protein RHGRI_028553 [Rhododendron griersonianum]
MLTLAVENSLAASGNIFDCVDDGAVTLDGMAKLQYVLKLQASLLRLCIMLPKLLVLVSRKLFLSAIWTILLGPPSKVSLFGWKLLRKPVVLLSKIFGRCSREFKGVVFKRQHPVMKLRQFVMHEFIITKVLIEPMGSYVLFYPHFYGLMDAPDYENGSEGATLMENFDDCSGELPDYENGSKKATLMEDFNDYSGNSKWE